MMETVERREQVRVQVLTLGMGTYDRKGPDPEGKANFVRNEARQSIPEASFNNYERMHVILG